MIITGKRLPRRTFLQGLGTVVALPMLDAMVPAFARSRNLDLKLRYGWPSLTYLTA